MTVLVTGAAGFIGYHVARALLARGERVFGIDNLNDYYDPGLKRARLERLQQNTDFHFARLNIADAAALSSALAEAGTVTRIIHLAAQAGVRHSLENPHAYIEANIQGQLNILELARKNRDLRHLVYASSSSVYGGNRKLPFAVGDPVESPISLYAATKRADELMGHCYAHLFRVPMTGLRFFTVYGPWGRPDMAAYIFTRALFAGEPIKLNNHGDMRRDFTYIDDIVAGVLAVLDAPPTDDGDTAPQRIYNIGNNHPEPLMRMIRILERTTNRKAILEPRPMQPGDAAETFADISAMERDFGFAPRTSIDAGLPEFVNWYRTYHGV